MRTTYPIIIGCIAALATSISTAQIYETTDAEGNPVFTDSPVNMGSKEVHLGETNLGDAPDAEAYPDQPETEQPSGPRVIIANEQPEKELNEGREVIIDDDEYNRRPMVDRRLEVTPRADVQTDLVDDQGREIDPKRDLPRDLNVSHPRPVNRR